MQNALIFVFRTLIDLYIITFVLRLMMQWVRADVRNPLVHFILRITNPLVMPLRRLIPPVMGFDTATFLVLLGIEIVATAILLNWACLVSPDPAQIVSISALRLIHLILNIYFFLIIAHVILSWVGTGTYNPAVALLNSIVEPVLRPFRRWIPPIGGIDLSPLFVFIAIGALMRLVPVGQVAARLLCTSLGGMV